MSDILENQVIGRMASLFPRAPHKLHDVHEADAELIDVLPGAEHVLAVKTDALVEEIATGLYEDPYLIGWMLAMANFSDLAAVGAEPLGLLVAVSYPSTTDAVFIHRMGEGLSAACRRLDTFVLGGDTNHGAELMLCGSAVGLVPRKSVITRIGATVGDRVYLTGPAGLGNVFALSRLTDGAAPPGLTYEPVARIAEGRIVREHARCCMDTSDGVIHTLDTLMRLNHCGFVIHARWEDVVHSIALGVCRARALPPWSVLAGVHGDFELCFTVSPAAEVDLLRSATAAGWAPVLLGEVVAEPGVSIRTPAGTVPVDTTRIRNLSASVGADPRAYVRKLTEITSASGIA